MTETRFAFFDELDTPLLGIISSNWVDSVTDELQSWMAEHGCWHSPEHRICAGTIFLVPDDETKLMFVLRWS